MTVILYILSAILILLAVYILFIAVCSLFINPNKEYSRNSRFYRFLLHSASAATLRLLRVRVHTTGIEKLPADTRLLFVGNHRSNFDPIIEWQVLKAWQPAFISKESNFKIPFFGRFIRKCCFMPIDRENPRNAVKTINSAAQLLKSGEVSIGVYPEGTRSKSCVLLPFHNGVFKIAQKANTSIAVLAITGSEKIHKQAVLKRSEVYVDVVDVIPAETVKTVRTDALGERARSALENGISKRENRRYNQTAI